MEVRVRVSRRLLFNKTRILVVQKRLWITDHWRGRSWNSNSWLTDLLQSYILFSDFGIETKLVIFIHSSNSAIPDPISTYQIDYCLIHLQIKFDFTPYTCILINIFITLNIHFNYFDILFVTITLFS